jgi:hypothetical protein
MATGPVTSRPPPRATRANAAKKPSEKKQSASPKKAQASSPKKANTSERVSEKSEKKEGQRAYAQSFFDQLTAPFESAKEKITGPLESTGDKISAPFESAGDKLKSTGENIAEFFRTGEKETVQVEDAQDPSFTEKMKNGLMQVTRVQELPSYAVDALHPYPTVFDGEQASKYEEEIKTRLERSVPKASDRAREVLKSVEALPVSPVDIWHGSHIVVTDGGKRYDEWKNGARERGSSHYRGFDSPQFEYDFPELGGLLFGKTPEGHSWFQFENHTAEKYLNKFSHVFFDYSLHKLGGDINVGPLGLSPKSEKNSNAVVIPG